MTTILYFFWTGFSSPTSTTSAAGARFTSQNLQESTFSNSQLSVSTFSQPMMA